LLDGISKKKPNKSVKSSEPSHNNSNKPGFILNSVRKSKLNFTKIIIAVVCVILISIISVYANDNLVNVRDQMDFVKLFNNGKYLIVFQNNAEARATGGFIGSYAILDIQHGKIKNLEIETNIYKKDNYYDYILKRIAPEPLASWHKNEGNPYWSMRDSNWAIDYPESAREIAWFYKNQGGQEVDGVIAINATFVRDLLKVLGPVNLPQYSQTITSENFFDVLHEEIEKKYWENEENILINEPKTILKDMYDVLKDRIFDKSNRNIIYNYIFQKLNEKEILIYFKNSLIQKIVSSKKWSGEVIKTEKDYLYVNNSNLGGMKSSLNMAQDVKLISNIDSGKIINRITIVRSHLGDGTWPDGNNRNYTRILVPHGSKLISASMDNVSAIDYINIGTEAGKQVFGVWFTVPIGQTRILSIEYELPEIAKSEDYELYIQKQPGSSNTQIEAIFNGQVLYDNTLDKDLILK